MSLLTALNSGTSGIQSASDELSIVGDNLANSNTVGYKSQRANFEESLSLLGSELQTAQTILTNGSLTETGVATDLALTGDGFFIVDGTHNGVEGTYYTRAGAFTTDSNGYLVNAEGLRVQGYTADASGTVGGALGDLLVGNATAQPVATENVSLKGNLQSDATVPDAWDSTDPTDTSNYQTNVTVYDSLGTSHSIQIYFRSNGDGTWEWHGLTDGSGVTGGTAGEATEIAAGTLSFDEQGRLVDSTESSNFNPLGAVQPQTLTFDFGSTLNTGGTGLTGLTQFASNSTTTYVGQDGYASGQLSSIEINSTGEIIGVFTNGQSRVIAQVAVADFPAADQLARAGGNLYTATPNAGAPVIGAAGEGGRASITSGSLEQSNVDMSSEFVRMIAAQRAFEANSKSISTADQLLSELISMKR